jgi:hypothetical protein
LARFSVAAVTVALLGTGGPMGVTSSAAAAEEKCDPAAGHSSARERAGSHGGTDVNDVTAAEARAMDRALQRRLANLAKSGKKKVSGTLQRGNRPGSISVPTYVHVITAGDGSGGVTPQQVAAQIQVMNDGFSGVTANGAANTPFRFVLAGTDYTANDDWFNWSIDFDNDDAEAKAALHQGGWNSLNIYITNLEFYLGYAYFPEADLPLELDGVVLLNESLPGGDAAPYNLGDTATHEVGHWLGLFHTFEGGCTAPGDYVADTPAQLDDNNVFECDDSLDTCADRGLDPVRNFMNYVDDACMNKFSVGQSNRMNDTWNAYRAGRR